MMNLKSTLKTGLATALAFCLLAAATAQAQDRPGRAGSYMGERGDFDPAAHLVEQLGLDDTQAEQVEALFEQAEQDRTELREAHRAENCELQAEVESGLQDILTVDQFAELEALKAERQARRAERTLRRGRSFRDNLAPCGD